MSEKSFKKSEFKRTIDLGKTDRGQDTDLIRVWRESSGEEKAISLGDINGGLIGDYVPYTGAVDDVDLGEKGLSTGYIKYDTTPTATPTDQGTTYWDVDDNTLAVIMNGTILKVGEDQYYPVKNQTGVLIPKGTAVRFAGTLGASGRLLIAPFLADGSVPSSRFMGVTSEDIDNGEDGKVMWFGRIRGINTNAFNEGDILYASTTVAGGFQTTIPSPPNNIVEVCAVIHKSVSNGIIFVRPSFITSVQAGAGLSLDSLNQIQLGNDGAGVVDFTDDSIFDNGIWLKYFETIGGNWVGSNFEINKDYFGLGQFIQKSSSPFLSTVSRVTGDINYIELIHQHQDSSYRTISGLESIHTDPLGTNTVESKFYLKSTVGGNEAGIKVSRNHNTGVFQIFVYDSFNSKGLVNDGDYESNFTARSLVTKQYVDGAISGAGHNPVTIGSPANGLSISGSQVLTIGLASTSDNGALSSTDWNTFNGKLNLTSPITGYTVGANTALTATDTILQAFGKVQGQINARVSGTIASGQVAFGTGVNTIGGDSGLTWDNTSKQLTSNGFTFITRTNTTGNVLTIDNPLGNDSSPVLNIFNKSNSSGVATANIAAVIHQYRPASIGLQIDATNTGTMLSMTNSQNVNYGSQFGTSNFIRLFNNRLPTINPNWTSESYIIDQFTYITHKNFALYRLDWVDTVVSPTGFTINTTNTWQNTSLIQLWQNNGSTKASINGQGSLTAFNGIFNGSIGAGGITPTNTLDVNGTTRIRTINNLGSAATSVLVPSATGVVSLRTATEFLADAGGISGTIASGQVAFGTGSGMIGGNSNLRFSSNLFSLGDSTQLFYLGGGTSGLRLLNNSISEVLRITQSGNEVRFNGSGIVRSNGGSLTLSTFSAQNILITPDTTGLVGISTTSPTNTLDVNGTARIRTINNLGTAATSVLVPSATGVVSLRTLAELASDGGFTNLWTLTGSDIYRNSKVTIGQTTIIDADLGIKQVDTDSALRIDGLARTTRRTILSIYEGTKLRHTVDNFGIPTWDLWSGSLEAGAITFTTPSDRIGLLIASTRSFTLAERCGISWSPLLTGVTDISILLTSRNTNRLQFGATGHFAIGNTSLISDSFGVINPNPSVTNALRILDGDGNTNLLVINNGDIQYRDGGDFILGTATGTKIGTATNQKIGFFNATPIVQPTTAVASGTLVSNAGTTLTSTDTIDGYTLQQVVRALRNTGLLA